MRKILLSLAILPFLSGCFAQRLELDDPIGLPLTQPELGVSIQSQSQPELARQLQEDLVRMLPRERQVRARALEMASAEGWTLQAELQQRRQLLEVPMPLLDGFNPSPRVRIELRLAARLSGPPAAPAQSWELVQRGDVHPDGEPALAQELLRILRDRLLQAMQAKYEYK